ncbi:helix-turn-helix domain-containing protein [Leifsonia sp. PS1209]|uniref:AraC-like ligand-binding domain-containing protein n=1 Tax=Leifsonia sp. PS1209 TaxID=2724914 RepID=UPI001FFB3A31|nr:helix-turn-helix domain-containing protein [Leifsonia sp. PS1209]
MLNPTTQAVNPTMQPGQTIQPGQTTQPGQGTQATGQPRANRVTTSIARNFSEFRTAVSESFVPLHVTSSRPDPFWGRIRSAGADEVHVSEVSAAEHVVERTPELIARSDRHYFKLSLQLSGTGLLIQDNREAVLQPGDLAVYDTHRPYSLVFDDDFRTMVVMFPKHLIDLPADVVAQLTAVKMSGKSGVGSIIVPFLAQLVGNLEQLNGATGARLAHSALDLVTTMFANELDVTSGPGNPHQALMQRIRGYIDANLASTDLGPTQIAAAHFISTRHLHGLFREQGTTVSSWIRTRRLERCRRDLLNPLYGDRPVAAIAARWGFVDAAHFSRVFKATYAESPSELRASGRAA